MIVFKGTYSWLLRTPSHIKLNSEVIFWKFKPGSKIFAVTRLMTLVGWNYVVQFGSTGFKIVHKNQPFALFLFINRFFTVKFADFKTIKIISLSIINSIIVVFSWTLNLYVLLSLKIYDQQRELDNSVKEGVISSNVLLERYERIKKKHETNCCGNTLRDVPKSHL